MSKEVIFKQVDGVDIGFNYHAPISNIFEKAPFLVFIHGGGFTQGNKDIMRPLVNIEDELLGKGYAIVSLGYRLQKAPRTVDELEMQYEDCMDGIRYVTKHAEEYNLDTEKMSLCGGSAGSTIALMCGLCKSNDFPGLKELSDITFKARCIVNFFGITDFKRFEQMWHKDGKGAGVWWRGDFTEDEKEKMYQKYSPINYLKKDSPPIFTIHGTADDTVPFEMGLRLHEKSVNLGHKSVFMPVTEGGHGVGSLDIPSAFPAADEWRRHIVRFIQEETNAICPV